MNKMDKISGISLVIGDGKCWQHKGQYLGKYLSFRLVGNPNDPDPEYTFEHGIVSSLGLKFTEVPPENINIKEDIEN
jgi:hypothetical protein